MSTNKHIDKICCIILIFTILITVVFCNAESLGVNKLPITMGYEKKLKEHMEFIRSHVEDGE